MRRRYKTVFIVLLFLLSGSLGFLLSWHLHQPTTAATETVIETFHYPALFVQQIAGDKHAGEKIFKEFCSACHSPSPSIDVKAPGIGDTQAWQIRRRLGLDVLLKITAAGIGAMPARGGCFECSDAQLRETIDYMLAQTPTR